MVEPEVDSSKQIQDQTTDAGGDTSQAFESFVAYAFSSNWAEDPQGGRNQTATQTKVGFEEPIEIQNKQTRI